MYNRKIRSRPYVAALTACVVGLAEGQGAQFIEDHRIGRDHPLGELSRLACEFLLLEAGDQVDGGEETDTP